MWVALLSLVLATPAAPVLLAPDPEGWASGRGSEFVVGGYADDAGIPARSVRLEFRAEDAGYGAVTDTLPMAIYLTPRVTLPPEGTRWCWRAFHINTANETSPPSTERCFRTDFTQPVGGAVDAGAIVSTGFVALDVQPATDALSGIHGYFLLLAPNATASPSGFGEDVQLPLQTWLGEGSWFGWVRVTDNAFISNSLEADRYRIPITVVASPLVPVPAAPTFVSTATQGWGDVLTWDASWMADAGVTHVVASFCQLDAGCEWQHGFHGLPLRSSSWLQVGGPGPMVARIAVVQNGLVGRWSAPSAPVLVDRTAPSVPGAPSSQPPAQRSGTLAVSWGPSTDDFTGVSHYEVRAVEQLSGASLQQQVAAPAVMTSLAPAGEGRFEVSVAAVDVAGNQSAFSSTAVSIIDATGPVSQSPVAVATPTDGGALVTLTWALPIDALSLIDALELNELASDGGAELVNVTGLSVSRMVPPGEWRWQLRGIDALGNVGAFSAVSNAVLITANGVVVGPSIITSQLEARCGEALVFPLVAAGDEPRAWTLLSGPPGLEVSNEGVVRWTPPAGSEVDQTLRVKVQNPAGFVSTDLPLLVTCDEETPVARALLVGWGCSSLVPLAPWALLALLLRRRRRA